MNFFLGELLGFAATRSALNRRSRKKAQRRAQQQRKAAQRRQLQAQRAAQRRGRW